MPEPSAADVPPAFPQPTGAPGARFWLALAGLLLIYFGVTCYRITEVPLIDPDEPRYAAAGRTMAQGGSWLVPQFNDKERINKPPLFYWMVAISTSLEGTPNEPHEVAARAPSILMGLFMLLTTVYLGYKLFGAATSLLAGAILAATPLFMVLSRTCTTDATMAALVTAALAVWLLADAGHLGRRPAFWLGTLFLGLAILTKATPVLAVVLILLLDRVFGVPREKRPKAARFIPWLLVAAVALSGLALHAQGRARDIKVAALRKSPEPGLTSPAAEPEDEEDGEYPGGAAEERFRVFDSAAKYGGVAAAAVVIALIFLVAHRAPGGLAGLPWLAIGLALLMGLWWYAALILQLGPGRFWKLVQDEVWGRVAGQMHREPMHYYLPMLFSLTFPWSMGLLGAMGCAWSSPQADRTETRVRRADRFLLAWLAGIVFFFSIPNAKLPTYILPAMPAVALLLARFLVRLGDPAEAVAKVWRNITLAFAAVIVLVLLGIGAARLWQPALIPAQYRQSLDSLALPFTIVWPAICVLFAAGWWWAAKGKAARAVLAILAFAFLAVSLGLPASMDTLNERSTKQLCLQIKQQVADCERFASVGAGAESLVYYLDRPVREVRRRDVAKHEPFIAVVREELDRPEKVVLFVKDRYCARMLGIPGPDLEKMSNDELKARIPDTARLLARGCDIVVIRNIRP